MNRLKPTTKKSSKKTNNYNLILNLLADEPNGEELWLIGEIWRLGRCNFSVNTRNSMRIPTQSAGTIILQMKATGRVVRLKSKSSVEEINLDEIYVKLDELLSTDSGDQSDLDPGQSFADLDHADTTVVDNGIHYLLQAKSEKSSLLREKALRAVKSLNPGKSEIIIHELPRDILRKFLYDPKTLNLNRNEDYRESLIKLGQWMQTKLAGKPLILFNHRDQQIDMYYR